MDGITTMAAPRRTWRWYVGHVSMALIGGALLVGGWMLYLGISTSIRAERNLHATLFMIRLVEQFVHENGRWPKSWAELERMPFPAIAPSPLNGELSALRIGGSHGYDWPAESAHLKQCVNIDFDADVNTIIDQEPMDFEAIKPIGPYFEYRDYGFVESLQATLSGIGEIKGDILLF